MRAWLLVLCACSGSQRAEQPVTRTPDAHIADAPPVDAGPPADAFVTSLIPADASMGPSPGRVIVTDSDGGCGGLIILDYIYFASGSSEIQPHQQPIVDATAVALACAMKDGGITKVEVQGHADDKERDGLRLSEERALRLANLLTAKGVPGKLLVVVGYGASQPLDRRNTAAARAKNRRVGFLILERKLD